MLHIKRFSSIDAGFDAALERLLAFEDTQDEAVDAIVTTILTDIKKRGDNALLEYTHRFDHLDAASVAQLELPKSRLLQALQDLPAVQREALEQAAGRVRGLVLEIEVDAGEPVELHVREYGKFKAVDFEGPLVL